MARSLDKTILPNYDSNSGKSYLDYVKYDFQSVRDFMFHHLKHSMDIPIKPLHAQSGYFMIADISQCADSIPSQYKESHDYENDKDSKLNRNRVFMQDGRIPLDLAFSRWMAIERGVIVMPCSLFYLKDSIYKSDKYVRIAICRGRQNTEKGIQKLTRKAVAFSRNVI